MHSLRTINVTHNAIQALNFEQNGSQGSTIGYVACVRTPTLISVHMILDMRTLTRTLTFSLWFFKVFKNFLFL